MVRSMYSGVSGLRSHQTRMDTIGNNIANVNTYGFKSGRTTFRDIYYQQTRGAAEPTGAQGGVNPSAIGYGSKVGSVDLMMGGSSFTMTDQTMDLAIDGEGFFQVQDANGNTFYTRAGMLSFDARGNLVDMQGNYVLGVNGDPTGRGPSSERISVTLGPVEPAPATITSTINGKEFTISTSNNTTDANLNISFTADSGLADNMVEAAINSTGIVIKMHPDNVYNNMNEFNAAVNEAITRANNGEPHVAGDFTIAYNGDAANDPFKDGPLTAKEICDTNYNIVKGSLSFSEAICGGIKPSGTVGNTFGAAFGGATPALSDMTVEYREADKSWQLRMKIGNEWYSGSVDSSKNSSGVGKFNMYNENGDKNDFVEMNRPSFDVITDTWISQHGGPGKKAGFHVDNLTTPVATGQSITIAGSTVSVTAADDTVDKQIAKILQEINDNDPDFTATHDGSKFVLTAREPKELTAVPTASFGGSAATVTTISMGQDTGLSQFGDGVSFTININDLGPKGTGNPPTATASTPSRALGFSSTSFSLRGGTAGGAQTLADMTGIQIGTNGVIIGYDSVGKEIIIGRIDLATFANPSGLNQAGSSNYSASRNSGLPILSAPGRGGAGQLVGTALEMSNVDLSREFSDMITTQRGYQANSRIITVSDTMLEELINLKR